VKYENDRLRISQAKLKALGKEHEEEYKKVTSAITENNKSIKENKSQMDALRKTIGLTEMSFPQLQKRARELRKDLLDMGDSANPAQFNKLNSELVDTERQMGKLKGRVGETRQALNPLVEGAKGLLPAFGFAAIASAAGMALKKIIASTSATADEFEFLMNGMSSGVDYFFQAIATGDWSNFLDRMNEAIRAGYDYAAMIDKIQDQTRGLSMLESDAAEEAVNLEIKLRNKLISKEERIKAGQDRIALEQKLVDKRKLIADENYNNELKEAKRQSGLSQEQLEQVAKDLNSEIRVRAEAYNEIRGEYKKLMFTDAEIDASKVIGADFSATEKEYAEFLRRYDILNDESQKKFTEAYVKRNEAAVSGKEHIKKIITQVNSLLAGEEENGEKIENKAAKAKKEASDKALAILDTANNERMSKLTIQYGKEGWSDERFKAEQMSAELSYLTLKKALLDQYGQSSIQTEAQISQKRVEMQKTLNDVLLNGDKELMKSLEDSAQIDDKAILATIAAAEKTTNALDNLKDKEKAILDSRQEAYVQFAVGIGQSFGELMMDQEATFGDYLKNTILMALDAFHQWFLIEKMKAIIQGISGGNPVSIAVAISKVAAMEIAYQGVRAVVSNIGDSKGKKAGGYTDRAASDDKIVDFVHANEFVGTANSVRNPTIKPVYDIIKLAEEQGTIATLNLPAIMGSGGLQSGGYSSASTGSSAATLPERAAVEGRDPELTSAINNMNRAVASLIKNGVQFPIYTFKKRYEEISDLLDQTGMGGFEK